MGKYSKAIVAAIALIVAILNASGFDVPEETAAQVSSTLILVLGTFGVYQITNKVTSDEDKK